MSYPERVVRRYGSDAVLYLHNHVVARVPIHTFRNYFLRGAMRVTMGEGSSIHMGLFLYTYGNISIGVNTVIDRDCSLDGRGGIAIGDNVNLAPEVMVLTASHDPDDTEGFSGITKPVHIGDYAWIATRAIILPGTTIGRGAVVGAGSVVTRDVEPDTIVAGNPARPIRKRSGPQRYVLDYTRPFH